MIAQLSHNTSTAAQHPHPCIPLAHHRLACGTSSSLISHGMTNICGGNGVQCVASKSSRYLHTYKQNIKKDLHYNILEILLVECAGISKTKFLLTNYQKLMKNNGAFRLLSFCISRCLLMLVFCVAINVARTNICNVQSCCERLASADSDWCTAMKSECIIRVWIPHPVLFR